MLGVALQKCSEVLLAAFAHLAEHPSGGFVDEVVRVTEIALGDGYGRVEPIGADERQGRHYGYALLPHILAAAQAHQHIRVGLSKHIVAYNLRAREVHEVPIIDIPSVLQIEIHYLRPIGFAALEASHQSQQRAEAKLVIGAVEHGSDLVERQQVVEARYGAIDGHGDAQKAVALAIFALAALEEAAQNSHFFGLGSSFELLLPREESERRVVSHDYIFKKIISERASSCPKRSARETPRRARKVRCT